MNHSTAQIRGYQTLKALFGNEANGISCNELATKLNQARATTIKDLQTLEYSGFAEQLPNKNWRVSSLLGKEAIKIMHSVNSARQRLDETATRYGLTT